MEPSHTLVYQPEVLDFVRNANAYVKFVESYDLNKGEAIYPLLLNLLTSVYGSFVVIPKTEPNFDDGNEKFVSEEDWSAVYRKTAVALGPYNEYLDIPEEEEFDRSDLVTRKISEDLADLYQDLKDFLELYRAGTEEIMNDALWECRVNFENYWGKKLMRACHALHQAYLKVLRGEVSESSAQTNTMNTDDWFITRRQKETGDGNGFPE